MPERCPNCPELVDYALPHCRCGHFLGWPNYRKAAYEQPDLQARAQATRLDLANKGLAHTLTALEALALASKPVISMDCEDCDDLLRNIKYRNYHKLVDIGDRFTATEVDHGDRLMVNERIYPRYGRHLQYAVLSPDGRGLINYGEVAVRWNVTRHYLELRSTLLEENEFNFFDRHKLGVLGAIVPSGYRAIWADRAELVIAKLGAGLSALTGQNDLPRLLLKDGANRRADEFVEVVIYSEQGIDARDIDSVMLLKPLADPQKQRRWALVEECCLQRGIRVS